MMGLPARWIFTWQASRLIWRSPPARRLRSIADSVVIESRVRANLLCRLARSVISYTVYPARRRHGTPQNYLTALAAHETMHQQWYGLVGNDQALELWLDEALCTYSELLFYEAVYPELVDWWWTFRVNRFQPSGWVDSTIYEHSAFRPYVNAVYLRGAQFVQAAREQVGDEVILAMLSDYAIRFSKRQASAEDFSRLLRAAGVPDSLFQGFFHWR